MTRPGNKILQFAHSKERGKTERVGGAVVTRLGESAATEGTVRDCANSVDRQSSPADSLWSSSHINFHHKRPNGTFVNGPEAMDSIARGVILGVLLATLVGLGFWLCRGFSQAERAIIHRLGK